MEFVPLVGNNMQCIKMPSRWGNQRPLALYCCCICEGHSFGGTWDIYCARGGNKVIGSQLIFFNTIVCREPPYPTLPYPFTSSESLLQMRTKNISCWYTPSLTLIMQVKHIIATCQCYYGKNAPGTSLIPFSIFLLRIPSFKGEGIKIGFKIKFSSWQVIMILLVRKFQSVHIC